MNILIGSEKTALKNGIQYLGIFNREMTPEEFIEDLIMERGLSLF